MKIIFKAFAKKVFGAKYEKLTRTAFIDLIVFWGLYIADLRIPLSSRILYLMISTFTAGIMWQCLASEARTCHMQNMMMAPFHRRSFVLSYTAALGAYTLLTKTAGLLAVLLAVSVRNPSEILGSILCAVNAVLMTAAVYSAKKYWYWGGLWTVGMFASILFWQSRPWFLLWMIVNIVLAAMLLKHADEYCFYHPEGEVNTPAVKGHGHYSVWRYFFRYFQSHKNYLANTAVMWCAALVLPLFFKGPESLTAVPIGFAILSLNTPVCILLSADPALEQAVRYLPGQKKTFCVPYCLLIFLCNLTANFIFLCSLQIQTDSVSLSTIAAALFFALQSAFCSLLLEWFFPVRGWKIESDLWHHPRKYIVPVIMLFLGAIVGALPMLLPILIIFLAVEAVILLYSGKQ